MLTTGRLVYHFHTRTKTGRSRPLVEAAPDAFVQMSEVDAERLGIAEGDLVRVTSRRGSLDAPARLGGMQPAEIFVPFHYGYWDEPGRTRAANELTLYGWDPVSKQPHFKYAAVKLEKVETPSRQPADTGSSSEHGLVGSILGTVGAVAHEAMQFAKRAGPPRAHLADYIGLLHESETRLARAFEQARSNHADVPDMHAECTLFAGWSRTGALSLEPFIAKYGERQEGEPERLDEILVRKRASTGFNLVRDLHDLWLLGNESLISIRVLQQAAQALRDKDLERVLATSEETNQRQLNWLQKRLDQAAPQALVVPS
jgi:hypothetical protein